jgi:parallel beta-helix repeat protein
MDASASSNAMIYFRSKEYTDSNYRPFLEVGYGTIYVDVNAAGSNNGTSWTNAFNKLQDALAVASSGVQIWVADGTYKPDQGGGKTLGDRTATFQLINGVSIYGGFAGGETALAQRDWQNNPTILSGDIGTVGNSSDNSYHILTGVTEALLDGFIIRDGNANGSYPNDSGAGIYNSSASPTLANCTLTANSAAQYAGAMYNTNDSDPLLSNCSLTYNSAIIGGGICNYNGSDPTLTDCVISNNSTQYGAGMFNYQSSNPKLTRCTLTANTATSMGGAITNNMSAPRLTNCILNDNAASYGGGICNNEHSSPLITNCIFTGNTASSDGGGVLNYFDSHPTLTNCSFSSNSAGSNGGGICNEPGPPDCSPVLTNCILWGNSDSSGTGQAAQICFGTPVVTYSCIKDSNPDDGSIPFGGAANHNIDDNPLFQDAGSGNLRISGDSPCIEAGSNAAVPADTFDLDADGNTAEPTPLDLDDRNRFSDGNCDGSAIVDMGAYELIWIYLGDLDADCDVDFYDFGAMASNWLAGK